MNDPLQIDSDYLLNFGELLLFLPDFHIIICYWSSLENDLYNSLHYFSKLFALPRRGYYQDWPSNLLLLIKYKQKWHMSGPSRSFNCHRVVLPSLFLFFFCLKNDMFQIRIASSACFAEEKDTWKTVAACCGWSNISKEKGFIVLSY